jgi:hypothetical protein
MELVTMCDYSLENYGSRTAREGERYLSTRFPSSSIGLTLPDDPSTAVCVSYGTELVIDNLPEYAQRCLGIGSVALATFVRFSGRRYRDGLMFSDGKCVLLRQLDVGVGATVLRIPGEIEKINRQGAFAAA